MKYIKKYEDKDDDFNYTPEVGDYIYLKCISPVREEYPDIFQVLRKIGPPDIHYSGYIVNELESTDPPGSTDNARYRYKKVPDKDLENYFMKKDAEKYNL
jgi:hypothetical protein